MTTNKAILAAAALLAVAACGGAEAAEDGTANANASAGQNAPSGTPLPDNLPDFAPPFPGATVDGKQLNAGKPEQGVVTYTASAKSADVIAFYKAKGEAAGLTVQQEIDQGESRLLAMMRRPASGPAVSLQVNAMPTMTDPSKVHISVGYVGEPALRTERFVSDWQRLSTARKQLEQQGDRAGAFEVTLRLLRGNTTVTHG